MPNKNIYYTVKNKIMDGEYQVECETAGNEGNHYLGKIIPVDYIDGLQTAELIDVLIPAKDEQSTESLRQEYLESFSSKAYGGNVRDYLIKTNSIHGVGATKVTPVWEGGGTVKLTILDANYNKASGVLIDEVQQTIDPAQDGSGVGIAPIGHIVTVATATEVGISIIANIDFDDGYAWNSAQEEAVKRIQNYLLELRRDWADRSNLIVRVTQIETRILTIPGIIDIKNIMINDDSVNLDLKEFEIPVYENIEFNLLSGRDQ